MGEHRLRRDQLDLHGHRADAAEHLRRPVAAAVPHPPPLRLLLGSGFGIPHWGNGNVYHEDADGNPFYDFTIADQTYDAIVEAGHHVLMEIAFTPRDLLPPEADELTVVPSPTVYSNYEAGAWAYPPKDYEKWRGLVAAHVQHCVERYGVAEVREWLFELWNEPDIFYWKGTRSSSATCTASRPRPSAASCRTRRSAGPR